MFNKKNNLASIFLFLSAIGFCQTSTNYLYTLSTVNVLCVNGAAGIQVDTLTVADSLKIIWSNGQTNVSSINNLEVGDYNVHLIIKNKKDTTLYFKIEKEECPVLISNHFTPNGDNYNDTWQLSNTSNYPNFELFVFNKWGQRIHSQKNSYTPWDGTWNGIKVADGTYYYVFYFEAGKSKHLKGDVTVLR